VETLGSVCEQGLIDANAIFVLDILRTYPKASVELVIEAKPKRFLRSGLQDHSRIFDVLVHPPANRFNRGSVSPTYVDASPSSPHTESLVGIVVPCDLEAVHAFEQSRLLSLDCR